MKIFLGFSLLILFSACETLQGDQPFNREVKNLEAFAKVYGHVRFFHPSDEASEIDWDKFAIHGVKHVKGAENDQELKEVLETLFLPIAPSLKIYDSKPDQDSFLPGYLDMIGRADTSGLKTVAWQHKGVYLGTDRQPYFSVRTYRNDSRPSRFFRISQYLDSEILRGKELRATGSVTMNHTNSKVKTGLFVAIDQQEPFGTEITIEDGINGVAHPEVLTDIKDDADEVVLAFYTQSGSDISIENITLEYRLGTSEWNSYPLDNSDFSVVTDEELAGWSIYKNGIFETGFVPESPNSKRKGYRVKSIPKLFNEHPEVGETAVQKIGDSLWSVVPLALYSNEDHTLPQNNNHIVENQFIDYLKNQINQVDLKTATTETEDVRLANLIITWNVFQHFYPYFDVVDTDWEQILPESLQRSFQDGNTDQFLETLQLMVAQLHDGHGVATCHESVPFYKPPIRVDEIEGNIMVTASQTSGIQVGDIIKNIDGKPAGKELERWVNLISGSPQLRKFRALNVFASGTNGEDANIELEKEMGKIEIVNAARNQRVNLFFSKPEYDYPAINEIEEGIYLINLRKINESVFKNKLNELSTAKGIIFDYRWGGNASLSMFEIALYLTDKEVRSPNWYIPKVIYPDQRNIQYSHETWTMTPKTPLLKGQHVILTVPGVVSSGETIMGIVDHYNLATTVGHPTAGTNGNSNYINLPGDCRVMWTGMKVLKHEDSQHHLIGYEPSFPVERTVQGVREGRDEFLEKAVQVIKTSYAN